MALAHTPLALTLGDPAGIGPDITLHAWTARRRESIPPFVVLGDAAVLATRAKALGLAVPIAEIADARAAPGLFADALPVLPIKVSGQVIAGHPDEAAIYISSAHFSDSIFEQRENFREINRRDISGVARVHYALDGSQPYRVWKVHVVH